MSDISAPRKRIKELEVMVAEVRVETPDTVTLVLFTGNDHLEYRAGHFLTIDPHQFEALERFIAFFEDVKGKKEPVRAYSMASAPHEKYLAVTVKEERYVSGATKYPPLLSPLLVRGPLQGTKMVITGFTGPYTLPDDVEAKTDHVVHVCAGSGGVPNFSMVKHALQFHPKLKQTFVYSNKTWEDTIFRRELQALAEQHADRLKVTHTLTREPNPAAHGPNVRKGRISAELLREQIPDPKACLVYVCGPAIGPWDKAAAKAKGVEPTPRFMESALAELKAIGVPDERIKRESYG
jgi:ferredoxin-NADP reductase